MSDLSVSEPGRVSVVLSVELERMKLEIARFISANITNQVVDVETIIARVVTPEAIQDCIESSARSSLHELIRREADLVMRRIADEYRSSIVAAAEAAIVEGLIKRDLASS